MKQMYKLGLLAMGLMLLVNFSSGQTTLSAGDIAFVGVNSDGSDDFAFITLVDLEAGTEIRFTDSGWISTGSFRNSEGAVKYTAPSAISAGTVIIGDASASGSDFTSDNDADVGNNGLNLSSSGDQILAFQGASSSPTFIAAINFDGSTWVADATSSNNSALPAGLTDATNAVSVPEADNMIYSGTTSGTEAELLAAINNASNWTTDDATPYSFTSLSFSIGAVTNTIVEFESSSATVSEGDGTYALTLTIANEDAVATSVDVIISTDVTPTADATDINNFTTQSVTFPSSDASNQTVTITLTDDATYEGAEVIYFELTNISGGNNAELGSNVIFELNITDNDPLPAETLPYSETFDSDLSGVYTFNLSGETKEWIQTSGVASMNGFNSGDTEEDWLILPVIDMDSYSDEVLSFDAEFNFGSDDANNFLKLVYSTDYSGVGDPSGASWTELSYPAPASSGTISNSGDIDVSGISGTAVYFAFQYRYESGSYRGWEIDNIIIEENPTLPEPTNHVTTFAAVANGAGAVDLTWSDNDGTQPAEGFLIKMSNLSAGDIANPADGTEEADGATTANVASGSGAYTFGGLEAETQYFFKIFPYTNSGDDINYKVDGTIPEASATTGAVPIFFISEVADPSDDAGSRFVELYNPTNDVVSLSGFYLSRQSNGGTTWGDIELSGTIAAGETFVVANNSPDYIEDYAVGEADIYSTEISSNGDDAYFIYFGGDHTSGSIFDIYGAIDQDGTDEPWEFLDSRAVRNSDVLMPNTTWTASEWTIDFPTTVSTSAGRFTPGTHFACEGPSNQATSLAFSDVMETEIGLTWARGNGDGGILIVVREGGAVDSDPESGSTYTANATFTSGDQIGTGNYVVYSGTGTDVTVNGLTQGTEYHFALYEYNSDNCYNLVALTGSQSTVSPNDEDSEITKTGSIEPATISGTDDTLEEIEDVFYFNIEDSGTGDSQPTLVTSAVIVPGAGNTANWATSLGGATLFDGTNTYTGTISASEITFDMSSTPSEVPSGSLLNYVLAVFTTGNVTDGDALQFEIAAEHGFTSDPSGSTLVSTLSGALTSTQHSINVVATGFDLDVSTTAPVAENFSLGVAAVDENGNIDTEARTVTLSKTAGDGAFSGTNLSAQAMTDGYYEWTDLQFAEAGDYELTVFDDGSALQQAVEITAVEASSGPALLLITEIAVGPTAGEFVEIYNASGSTVLLDDYYITDATFAGGDTYYYNIVTGANAGGGGFADWHARFPSGSTIAPGEVQTISLAGSDDFFATYGINPTYELYEDGSEADAVPDMLEATTGSINDQGGLTDSGEIVMLYYWDGASDLVTDIDYVMWGDQAEAIDKSGISIDGPDGDTDASTYQDDLATSSQTIIASSAHSTAGNSWSRIDFEEGEEVKTGGNGVNGHNEMTEDLDLTFTENTANPGSIIEPGSPLIGLLADDFNGNFGFVAFGESSTPSVYAVVATDLAADLVIAPPAGFELSATEAFDGTIYTNASPWSITPVDGIVEQGVYVRFTPSVADGSTYSGNISHESTDAETKTLEVSGIEGTFSEAPNLSGIVINEILPDPNFSGTTGYDTDGSGGGVDGAETEDEFVEIYNSSESPVDISGWQLVEEDGVFFTFPASTTLGAGNYAAVMASVQTNGTLPTPSEGNFAFESDEAARLSISNGGENIALYDPNSNTYVQMKFNGDGDFDFSGITGGTLVSVVEDWGNDTDGSSLVREPAGSTTIVVHETIDGADAASFAEPTIDPDAPAISIVDDAFDAAFGNILISTESDIRTYTVSGINLEDNITITAPTGFLISDNATDYSSSLTLNVFLGVVEETTISVKFVPSEFGSADGTITHMSPNASQLDIDVSGAGIDENTIYFNGFGSCEDLSGFTAQSVSGVQEWTCTSNGETGDGIAMSGFSFDSFSGVVNEDWIVSPSIDLGFVDGADLSFDTDVAFDGTGTLTVYISADYAGDVTTATWTEIDATLDIYDAATESDGVFINSGSVALPVGQSIHVAFKYVSADDANGAVEYRIDNFLVEELSAFFDVAIDSFSGDFGDVNAGSSTSTTSFTVSGFALTGSNVSVTPPEQFEVSTTSDFSSNVGTSSSPLLIDITNTRVSDVEVFARFSPTSAGNFSGDISILTDGYSQVDLAVSGTGLAVFEVDDSNFGGEFNNIQVGSSTFAQSFIVDGFALTGDVTVTPPAQFEVSTSSDFSANVGTSTSALTITATDGAVDGVEVFVRFSPSTDGTFSGNVTVSTTGFDDVTLSVSGTGTPNDPVLGLSDLQVDVYPNPTSSSFTISNDGNQKLKVKLFGVDGTVMKMKKTGNQYDISHLSSGLYILKISNNQGEEMTRRILKQ